MGAQVGLVSSARAFARSAVAIPLRRLRADTIWRNRVPLNWHIERNWGDAINPILAEMISGRKVYLADDPGLFRFLAIGSVLHLADSNTEVWGSGFIRPDSCVLEPPRVIHAVRGPLTRDLLLRAGVPCPEVFGDPALLLPRYWNPSPNSRIRIGLIPHMVDARLPVVRHLASQDGVKLIDIQGDLLEFVREVKSCDVVLSSSLHGLICADAYGIPNRWIMLSDGLVGGAFKFNDYYSGIGQSPRPPLVPDLGSDVTHLAAEATRNEIRVDLDALQDACPFGPGREWR